jgi:hypothetical protein
MQHDLAPTISRSALTVSDFKPILAGAMIGFVDTHQPSGTTFHRCGIFKNARRPQLEGRRDSRRHPIARCDEAGTRRLSDRLATGQLAMELPRWFDSISVDHGRPRSHQIGLPDQNARRGLGIGSTARANPMDIVPLWWGATMVRL